MLSVTIVEGTFSSLVEMDGMDGTDGVGCMDDGKDGMISKDGIRLIRFEPFFVETSSVETFLSETRLIEIAFAETPFSWTLLKVLVSGGVGLC